jgi:general secretion pathway protein J
VRKVKSSKGYTLIEVMVAIVIFSSMMLLAGVALNQGLGQYRGLVDKGLNFWDHAQKIWLDKSFHSMTDYYIFTKSDRWFPYFKGDLNYISYITLAPLVGDEPVVVWLKKEQEENNKFQLLYYEMPVHVKTAEDLEKDYISNEYRKGLPYAILAELDQVDFSFYGCDAKKANCHWQSAYDGKSFKFLPDAVKISYRRGSESGFLLFSTNVNSEIKKSYDESLNQQ